MFLVVLFCLSTCSMLLGLEAESDRLIVVAVPARVDLQARSVEQLVEQAKSYRADLGETVNSLPIVRLSGSIDSHATVLRELGLKKLSVPVVYLCRRGARGWPVALIEPLTFDPAEHIAQSPANQTGEQPQATEPAEGESESGGLVPEHLDPNLEIGYLLYYQTKEPESSAQVQRLVKELGRFWLERYGRARPAPFPLAFYDASNPEVRSKVASVWPEMDDGSKPTLYLVSYRGKQPERILASVHDLDLPAQAIRTAASLRRQWQKKVQLEPGLQAPGLSLEPESVTLDDREENELMVIRIRELAQQIWSDSEQREKLSPTVQRDLIAVVEQSRRFLQGEPEQFGALSKTLEGISSDEALSLPSDGKLSSAWKRLLSLSRKLRQSQ